MYAFEFVSATSVEMGAQKEKGSKADFLPQDRAMQSETLGVGARTSGPSGNSDA